MYPRLHALLARDRFGVSSMQPAAVTSRDRLLAPLALLVSGTSRFVPASRRKQMDVAAATITRPAGGAYLFVEAVQCTAASSDPH